MSGKSPKVSNRKQDGRALAVERAAAQARVESLEHRQLLAFTALVNFQPAGASTPAGYVADTGGTYGARNGLTYGWDADNSSSTRDRNNGASPDQRYDTLTHTQLNGTRTWEIGVPNGDYVVRLVSGDANYINSTYRFNVEGKLAVNATPSNTRKWIESSAFVNVSDGRLTLTNASGAVNNKINFIEVYSAADFGRPSATGTIPLNGATGVSRDTFIGVDLSLPGGALSPATVTGTNVKLFRVSDGTQVPANVNTSGGGDSIVLTPTSVLDASTAYYFEVTSGVKDVGGNSFVPFSMTFTTGTTGGPVQSEIEFTKHSLSATGHQFTAVAIGPDRKVYAGTLEGLIIRYSINSDGTLGSGQTISSIQNANGGPRLLTGFVFDPSSTASNLILYVIHGDREFDNPPHWSGKLTRLTGSNLATVQDILIGLPRAAHNHLTNQPVFGPDGAMYFAQGGNTAQGAKDSTWGLRDESLLSAAILRLDFSKLPSSLPLNVRTEGISNAYNPWPTTAPLRLYASGVRNAWDITWTADGKLFAPNNGSNAGGATPGTPSLPIPGSIRIDGDNDGNAANGHYSSPSVPGINPLNEGQNDYMYLIQQNGYYGHPNPSRYEYVLNGGNPTSSSDPQQVGAYPVGTQPDRNYRGAVYDFGPKRSPNGIIEYRSNAFGGALAGKLLVVRYSGGDDIIILSRNSTGQITGAQTGIAGMTGFNDPLDLIEDPLTGNIYVAEHTGAKLTLLKPVGGITTPGTPNVPGNVVASAVSATQTRVTWNSVTGATLYRIQRKGPGESSFSNYGTSTTTSFDDLGVSPSSTYQYQVRAENSTGQSAYSSPASVTTPAAGAWSQGVPLPFAMAELGGAIVNGRMYVAGENNTSTWEFNFTTNQWTARAVRPFTGNTSEAELARETVNGLLYLIGGLTGGSENKVQIYNPTTNSWTLGAQRSYNAGSSLSAVINGQIYVAGGAVTVPSYQPVANNSRYNPSTNSWTSLAPMPLPRHSAAGGTDGSRFFIFGGRNAGLEASDGTDTVQIYNPANNTWETSEQSGSTIPRMPRPMRGAGIKAIYYNGEFYIFGGENSSGDFGATDDMVFDDVLIYNPTSKTWRNGTPMPTARHATLPVLHNNKIYIVGGGTVRGTSFSTGVEVLDLLAGTDPTPTVPSAPSGLAASAASSSQINLNWTDNSNNETGFRIERRIGTGGAWEEIATVGAGVTTYQSTALTPSTQYFYQVRAYNGAGNSGYSNTASATTQASTGNPAAFQQDSGPDGILSIQAENYDNKVAQGGHDWALVTPSGASNGQAMQATPNTGINVDTNYAIGAPRLDYNVNFVKTGIHYVWVRGIGLTSQDDSLHVGLNGQETPSADRFTGFKPNLLWIRNTSDGVVATINVTTPGPAVLNIWMREDGVIADKIVLTTNSTYTPTSTGPSESPRSGGGGTPTAPAAPSGLTADASAGQVDLDWTDNSNDETGFRVERKEGAGGTWGVITTTGANATSYSDTTVSAGTTYFYRVRSTNGVDSAPSNEASATTPAGPEAPSGLTATPISQTQVNLAWTDNSSDETGFKIERKTGAGGTWQPLTTTAANDVTYSDTTASAGTTYFYRVIATAALDSAPSNEAQATTPGATAAFTSADIGAPTPAGSTQVVNEGVDYNITVGGANIWSTSDSFRFAYQSVTGDFDYIVRINSLTAADPQSMAGLMARDTLNANSRNAFIKVWPGTAGYRFTYRTSTGGTTTATGSGAAAFPNAWMRLQREGSTFRGFMSSDGTNWTQVGSVTINLPATIFVGMAASAKSTTTATTAQFRDFGPGPTAVAPRTASSATSVTSASFSSTAIGEEEQTSLVASEDPLANM